ncbi:hypothetical protein QE382_002458 [Sphingobacterium zeae]|uniref:Uncharacterized protein n=1 Tax=Sphingobacterium zeae TaxID=1776859 RepID=A0ABU0U6M1_9SPHI|nr:hypothetical protein [Sphingobacterium zeae]MDQ1150474.1 hypothetical protein [Sphingobacterium zeae]
MASGSKGEIKSACDLARRSGIIKLKNAIGDINFYKSRDGYLAKQKGGIDKECFHNDQKFQGTRENSAELARGGKASKVLCTVIRLILNKTQDSPMILYISCRCNL